MPRKRLKLGDVLELVTPCGLAYIQHIYKDGFMGSLIRILPGTYAQRPENIAEIVAGPELYFVYFPTSVALWRGIIHLVDNFHIPYSAQKVPVMRRAGGMNRQGDILNWWIKDAEGEQLVKKLSDEQKKLSIYAIWNDTLLMERICEGWRPKDEF